MTEQHNYTNITQNISQVLDAETLGNQHILLFRADGSPLLLESNSFTLAEHLIAFLNTFDEASPPPEVWAELLLEFLRALPRIAESLDAQPDYSSLLRELIEEVRQTKEIIQSKPGGGNARS